jgi:hypothetical protein
VERRLVNKEGVALVLDPVPLALAKGEVRCQRHVDSFAASKVGEGHYRVEVSVQDPTGNETGLGVAPLRIVAP